MRKKVQVHFLDSPPQIKTPKKKLGEWQACLCHAKTWYTMAGHTCNSPQKLKNFSFKNSGFWGFGLLRSYL